MLVPKLLRQTLTSIVKEGEELADLHEQIVVKVPMIKDGIKAINILVIKASELTVLWCFLQDRRFWLQKPEQLMFLLLLEDWMIFLLMG